jgi:hypothetical protein
MSRPVTFQSWFAMPRTALRRNADEPQTAFERVSSPETRMYLHLLKLRVKPYHDAVKPFHDAVEIRNLDLMKMAGLDRRALHQARQKLTGYGLIKHAPTDRRGETHLYTFTEAADVSVEEAT